MTVVVPRPPKNYADTDALPTLPVWIPPADTGQPSAADLNELGTLPKANFAAANQIIPITYGRDRLFGQQFVVHVDDAYLYVAFSFCEGQINGFEQIIIDSENALSTGKAFEGVKNRGWENGDKTGWDLEADQDGTVNASVSRSGDYGLNIPAQNATAAIQSSNRLVAPPEGTVMKIKAWAARNTSPDCDAQILIKEAATVGGALNSGSVAVVQVSGGDQTVAGWQEMEVTYTVPAGVAEYTICMMADNTGTATGSWDFDDVSAAVMSTEDVTKEAGIEVCAYVGSQSQKFDGMLSSVLTGYTDDLPGLAYVVARCPKDSTRGFPRLEAIIQGRVVYDPRLDSTAGALGPELTYARTGPAWVRDWEGIYHEVEDDEPRLDACRRVKNYVRNSEDFSIGSGWSHSNVTVTEGAIDSGPFKGKTAWTMTNDTTNDIHWITRDVFWLTDGGRKVESMWVKYTGSHRYISMARRSYTSVPESRVCVFDLQDEVFTFVVASHNAHIIERTDDGWIRIGIDYPTSTGIGSDGNYILGMMNGPLSSDGAYIGTGTNFQFTMAQGEQVTGSADYSPQEYVQTGSAGPAVRVYNTDRQGHQLPLGRGINIEEARTNVIGFSNDISDAAWTVSSGTPTLANATERLFENHTGIDFLNDNAGADRGVYQDNGTFTNTEDETFSVIIENDDALDTKIGIYDNTAAAWLHRINYDWGTQTVSTSDGSGTSKVEDLGTGPNGGAMVRLTVTGTGTAAGTGNTGNSIRLYIYPTDTTTNALSAVVYHTQFERNVSFASSPIVTTSASDVTRNADDITGTDVSWYNELGGTLVLRGEYTGMIGSNYGFSITDGSDNNRIVIANSSFQYLAAVDGGVQDLLVNLGSGADAPGEFGQAVAFADNDVRGSLDGGAVVADTAGTLPSGLTQFNIGRRRSGLTAQFNGFIKELRYYNVTQDNAWLQSASNDEIEDGGANHDPSLVMGFNFGRDMSIHGIGVLGGDGTQRADDSTTWAYSNNPTLAFRDLVANFTGWDILDAGVIENADLNDEFVSGVPRRQIGLTLGRANKVDAWIKAFRTYMGGFLNWEGGKVRIIPNRPTVEAPGATDLDGTAGTEINMGDEATFDLSLVDHTFELSVQPRTLEDDKVLLSKKAVFNGIDDGYAIYTRANGECRVTYADGAAATTGTFADVFTAGQYTNISVVMDFANDEMSLYVDGVAHSSNPVDITAVAGFANTEDFLIGNDGGGGNEFDGFIDEVRVWNDIRTPAEIADCDSKEIENPTGDTSLIGYWKLNEESSATVAVDSSISAINGTLGGNATFTNGNAQIIPDGVAMHITTDDMVKDSLDLTRRSLRSVPNSVAVDYEDSSGSRWFTARAQADSVRVTNGDEARRLSRVSMPGIHNASQAQREAVERLNWYLTDLECSVTLFDEGWELTHGSIVAITHPIGLDAKLFRVRQTTSESGRWTVDLVEYDPAVYSDDIIADPTIPDTNLGDPLNPPTVSNLVLAEELFNYKTGTTGSRVRITFDGTTFPFLSQYLVEGYVGGAKVWQTTTLANDIVTPGVEEIVDTLGTPTDYEVRVTVQSPFASGPAAIENVQIDGKFAIPSDPTGASATQTFADEVDLTWLPAVDIDIWRYEVRRGSTSDTWATATSLVFIDGLFYTDTGLPLGTYRYFIKAIDSVKQESANAATVDVTLSAPTAVSSLFGFEVASEVRLNWPAVTGEFAERYRIAYSDIPETFETTLDIVDTIRFQTKDVPEGTFTFKAYTQDKVGNEAATAATIDIEVTSDADSFLADSYDFNQSTSEHANGSLTNFVEWDLRLDDKKYYVTNMGDAFAVSPTDFVAADPLANYHSTGASEWLSETKDFGLLLTGSWNLTQDVVALQGNVNIALELSTDDVTYVSFGGSAKGEYRYARVRISTSATPGTATAFVKAPTMNLKINVVPIEENGEDTSSGVSGTGATVNLEREYTALKEITTQPKNTIASGSAVTSIVDNIITGSNTAVTFDGVSYLLGGDWAEHDHGTTDFSIEFWAKNDGTGTESVIYAKRGSSTATGYEILQLATDEIRVSLDDGTVDLDIDTSGTAFPDDGQYHHVSVTVDRTGDLCKIRIDGVEEASTSISTLTGSMDNATSVTVGCRGDVSGLWEGAIDQLRVWSDLRTPAEIDANKDIALDMTQTQTGLIAYWLMDGGVGDTVTTVVGVDVVNDRTLTETGAGTLTYTDPGNTNPVQKINSFDVYIFDTFGQQLAEQFQWKWKGV